MYYNPKTGFSGINDLVRKSGLKKNEVEDFLNQQETYTLHKPARKNFDTRRVFVHYIDQQWQADLVEMIPYEKDNNGFRYLLTVIDCFSKYAWSIPIHYKRGKDIVKAFNKIFKIRSNDPDSNIRGRKPSKIQTDLGKEFYNKDVQQLFKENNIIHFSTHSNYKASIVERFNRTLKEKMWKYFTNKRISEKQTYKWIDILDDLMYNYNNSYHSSIKMTPVEASKKENLQQVDDNLFSNKKVIVKKPKFKIGDLVRINKYKSIFAKGYLPNYTKEVFVIDEIIKSNKNKKIVEPVITYKIKALNGEEILGIFYEKELVLFKKD